MEIGHVLRKDEENNVMKMHELQSGRYNKDTLGTATFV